ncbi:MAG: arginine repressor [Angelakisella sp.]
MKAMRHKEILNILASHSVTTQEELQELLSARGFSTTQATVSRDIRELRLIKALSPSGSYCYTTPQEKIAMSLPLNINAVFLESIKTVDHASNFVVVKCYAGMANAVCASIDNGQWDGLVGTIAGDDTIFLLLRTEEAAIEFSQYLLETIRKAK